MIICITLIQTTTFDYFEVLSQPLCERDYDVILGNLEMFGNPKNIVFCQKRQKLLLGREQFLKNSMGIA